MRLDHRALADVAALLREAARAEILPRFRRLAQGEVRTKTGPLDLVTDADEAAERVIEAGLAARFPGCLVVGEEGTAADPALLGRLAGAELAFVVDPVDGTANFAAGLPLFGTMAAAIVRGEIVAAWIHDPLGDDTAVALRGEGAWIEAPDGHRHDLRVAAPVPVEQMVGSISWSYLAEPLRSQVTTRLSRLRAVVGFRCAAHEYRLVAGGHAHALLYNRLMPWDHAPGWLLHREAGGYAARFDGSAYGPLVTGGGMIVAPDRTSWEALRAALLAE
ncbi:inositol monophosphatase family protein [Roseicella aerolata]|uniref:Inositol monophosphatase n=1 Tax=Roseicella aerolata TaxID=2883479 RepID=A0A9X1IEK8_9PROT|nr:inositol monophosphatase family protein [Roseicella aerolata]MCB4821660.1 inositol monophosphatase [Roseicella aerolata]